MGSPPFVRSEGKRSCPLSRADRCDSAAPQTK
nr:MAG TPA: hypothetical protein [Caudoviricetes sp.]